MTRIKITVISVLIFPMLLSCSLEKKHTVDKSDFIQNTVDYVIKNKDNNVLELPFIYDSLASQLPADSSENLLLADALQERGFEIIDWGRGNYPPRGPRIVMVTLQKNSCICEVSKIYYATTIDTLFEMTERISCKDTTIKIK